MNTLLLVVQFIALFTVVKGHGRLIDPPARVTLGRFFPGHKYHTTDQGFNCGGTRTEKGEEIPQCHVCGAPLRDTNPVNEPPNGIYAKDFIVKTYTQGQTIEVESELTANHKGEMEYRICENNIKQAIVDYDCFNKNLLVGEDGVTTAFKIAPSDKFVTHRMKLPSDLSCSRCILQWRYRAGNSWGKSQFCTGSGCGPQETFQACADIEIKSNGEANKPEIKPDVPENPWEEDVSVPSNNNDCNCSNALSQAMCHSISNGRRWSNRH